MEGRISADRQIATALAGASRADGRLERNSALVNFALAGLDRCWMPESGSWSHIYYLDRLHHPNESVPKSDVFYTLNVLLGMSRVRQRPKTVSVAEIFKTNAMRLCDLDVPVYAYGMALWTAAELKVEIPPDAFDVIERHVVNEGRWIKYRAQDLGMLLIGVVAQLNRGQEGWTPTARRMYSHLLERYDRRSHLFGDGAVGYRRRFATFATQTYMALAAYVFGEHFGICSAIAIGNECAGKLITLQGPHGEWPWLLDVRRGCVLDYYEVYSVHQYGMAPAFLEFAERYGVVGARGALVKGFKWVLGDNQLDLPMIIPELSLSVRSQVRRGELGTKMWRISRALARTYLLPEQRARLIDSSSIVLRRECRSYELGWILWSFGQRDDIRDLTENAVFLAALGKRKVKR